MTAETPLQVVFIDSRVPDIQDLLDGLQPGEQAFVIDPSSDGVDQIADILAAHNFTNLASISIVSHGETGELELGSSFITDGNLAGHSNALAEIGSALAPGGNIQLYGCDVAQGAAGQQFINDFSTYAGGVTVDAATHSIGSSGGWTLDAVSTSGVPPVDAAATAGSPPASGTPANGAAAAPFTQQALANFQGELVVPTTEIWAGVAGQNQIVHADDTGNGTATNSVSLYLFNTNFHHVSGVAIDPNQQKFFVLDHDDVSLGDRVLVGSLVQALNTPTATPTFTTITLDANKNDLVTNIQLDTINHQIYFVDVVNFNTGSHEISKFERVNYDGSSLTNLGTVFNSGSGNGAVVGFALDPVNHTAVFEVNQGGFISVTVTPANATLYEATGVSAAAASTPITQLKINNAFSSFATSLGFFTQNGGIQIDPTTQIAYFTLEEGASGHAGGLYKYSLVGNPSGTFSVVYQETSTTQPIFNAIAIDPVTSKWYGVSDAHTQDEIWSGSLVSGAPSMFLTFANESAGATELSLDNAPTLAVTPTNNTFTESTVNPASTNNTPVGVITSDTVGDADGGGIVSATVSVGSFFAGDVLSASTAGTSVTSAYNSTTGVLTLTGLDSFAHYQTVLATVQFTSTSDNPTNYGSDNSRALIWSVNDGLITSAPQTAVVTVVGVNDPPTLSGTANSTFTERGGAKTMSPVASVFDVDSLNLGGATVSITGGKFAGDGDVLAATTTGTSITASYNSSTETLVLSGSDTLAHYQQVLDSVTFNEDPNKNPTNYGSNTSRTVTWQINDGSGSFNLSTVLTTTIGITAVNDPPTLTGTTGTVAFTEGTPRTLSPSVTVADPDNLTLAGATVVVVGGTFAGDGDVLATSTVGTAITASYNTTSETLTLSGVDTLANYQTVLDRIQFTSGANPDDYGSQKTRTVSWVLNDGSGSSNTSAPVTTTISVTAINDPPVLASVAPSASYVENAAATTLAATAAVSDVDSLTLANATVKIVGGTFAGDGDVLGFSTASTSITASYNASTETLTLSGSDTLAHYQSVLDHVTFSSSSDNPDNFGGNTTRTLTWLLNDGAGSNNLSSVTTTTVSVTAVNDRPTLTGTTNAAFTENGASVALSPSVTVSDPDNQTLVGATVKIAGGTFAADGDVLAADTTGTSISASYDAATETLFLTGTDTLADYQAVLDRVTFTTPSDNPTNFGAAPTRTVTWVLNDGSGSSNLSAPATTTISLTATNDAPTLSAVPASASYTENATATVLASTLTATDPDNVNLTNATVKITGGTFAGDGDVLSFSTAGTSITASYNAGTETLTLGGTDTVAHYQQVLDSVAFSSTSENPDNFGSNTTRTVTWVVNDGSGSSNLSSVATTTVTLTAVNDNPTLTGTTNAAFTENGAAATLSPSVTVADPDNQTLTGATVQIVGGTFAGDGDVLAANTAGTSITASYDAGTETLTLSGSDTLAHYRQVLDTITFTTASDNPTEFGSDPTRTVAWVLNDGSGSNNLSTTQTTTISITATDDAPTLSAVPSTVTVATGATVALASAAVVSDPDNFSLLSATVSVTAGAFTGDVLGFDTSGTAITASYDTVTEKLTLTGTDTLANYQSVLDSITFSSIASDPTNAGANPTRTLSWVLNDGTLTSTPQIETITVQNAPAVNPPAHAGFTENQAAPTTLAPALVLTDPNTVNAPFSISATVAIVDGGFTGDQDVLTASVGTTGILLAYDTTTETLTLTGSATDTLADFQSVLDTVSFNEAASDNPTDFGSKPSRTVVWTVNDGTTTNNTGTATSTIDITAINDQPTLSGIPVGASTFIEKGLPKTLAGSASVADPDNQTLANATVQITGGMFAGDGDVLDANTGGTFITESYDSATETLTLSGSDTLAHYRQALEAVTFTSTSLNPTNYGSNATRTVTWVVNDGSGSFNLSAPKTEPITITAVNDAPTIAAVATDTFVTGQTLTLSPTLSVSDPDNQNLASATVSIAGSFAGDGDVLAAVTTGTTISASYDTTNEVLVLSGSDTVAHYQQVLDSVTFSSGGDPTGGGTAPTRTVTWTANDGLTDSTAQTTTVSLQVGPAIFVPDNAAFTEGQAAPTTLETTVALSDSNAGAQITSATVKITGGTFAGDGDLLSADTSGAVSITASYDAVNEALVLSGTDTIANYRTVLDTVAFTTASDNPTDFGSAPTRTVTWTVFDDQSSNSTGTATSTINLTGVNDPPTLSAVATGAQYTENAAATVLSSAASVLDPDSLTLVGATVSITTGKFAGDGDVLSANTSSTSITASYDSTSEALVLSGSDTLAHYQQVLDSVAFSSTSDNPTDYGSVTSHQVTWVLDDGGVVSNTSTTSTTTVTLTAVNDAPTVTGQASSVTFAVNSTVTLSPSISVSDPDNLMLTGATVSVTGGTFGGDGDVLAVGPSGNITSSYDAATETLVLHGLDTLADYQFALDHVTFASGINPNNGNANPTRTITWVVNDGSGVSNLSSPVTTTVNIDHTPPTLTSVANTLSFTQANTTTLSPSLGVVDFDSANLSSATVKITGGTFAGDGDVLSATTAGTLISASYNAALETLILTGSDSLVHYQSVLDSVTFRSGSDPTNHGSDPTRIVTWVVNDGNGSSGLSASATTTITITPLDAAPTLSTVATSASFTENGAAVTLSGNLSVSDPDSTFMSSATVSITGGVFAGDGDTLAFSTASTSITASYDSTNEVLLLSGSDTLAHYKQVLDSVTFGTASDNPTDFGSDPSRTVTWTIADDFNVHSAPATTTVNITATNDPPTLTSVASTVTYTAGTTLQLSPALTVTDVDSLNIANATVKVIAGGFVGDGDQMTANVAGTHITASYDGASETLTLTGSDPLATYQAVLESIAFSSGANAGNFGSNLTRTLTWVVNDGSSSNNLSTVQTTTIDISTINTPPALANVPASVGFTEGQSFTLAGAASVVDPDNVTLAGATVKITGGIFAGDLDALNFDTTGTTITASYNSSTETLTLTGNDTKAHYTQVLDSITFSSGDNPDNYGSNPTRTVTWLLDDGSASNNLSTVQTETIGVTPVNDPPTLTGTANAAFTENGASVTLSPSVTVSDPDNLGLVGATVAITGGTFAGDGDILGFSTAGTSISASYNAATETLTLSGFDTFAHYAQVLDTVTFVTASDNPDDYGSAPTRTISWTLNDGSASSSTSTVSTTVSITAINDAPTLSSVAASASWTEKGPAVTLAGNASVADPDNLKLANATVKIVGGTFAGDGDVLAATAVGNITVNYNAASETLTLTGSDTLAHYQQVLDSLTFNSTSLNPTFFGLRTTRTVTWVVNDGSGSFNTSTPQTETVSLTAVNDAPTVAAVTGVTTYIENAAGVTASPTLSVTDPDSAALVNATVSVGNGFAGDGDVLTFSTTGTSITGSYNAATETLVFSGADSAADYQSVLDSVVFSSSSDNPTNYGSNLSRVLTWVVNDGSASNNLSAPQFTTVVVTAVNDAPTLTNVATLRQLTIGHTLTIAPAASVSDPDNQTLANATVKVTAGTFAGDGDVLGFNTAGTSISASYNVATETLTLSGSDTLAHYAQVIDTVTFASGNNPTNNGANPTRTVTWTLNDGSGSNNLSSVATTISIAPAVANDFDGDGQSDLLFQDTDTGARNRGDPLIGTPQVWLMNNTSVAAQATLPNPGATWSIIGTGDFNSDADTDLLLEDPTGNLAMWEMNGSSVKLIASLGNVGTNWKVLGVGDFNGDGNADLLWEDNSGNLAMWEMNGPSVQAVASLGNVGTSWKPTAIGDFNGDGKADILWLDGSGNLAMWEMNGPSVQAVASLGNVGTSWKPRSTGDFNGDGKADILWQDVSGNIAMWEMNGPSVIAVAGLGNGGGTWLVAGTGDYNGDSKADILFQNTDGTPVIWTMNGTSVTAITVLPNPGQNWHAVTR